MRWLILTIVTFLGCTHEQSPPQLSAVPSGKKAGVVRVAGPVAAYGVLSHLAKTFMDRHRNHTIVVESPLGTNGAHKALKAGLLEAVVTIEAGEASKGRVFAQSQMVFALGPGIEERRFDDESLKAVFNPDSSNWSSGVARRYVKRSIHDPLNEIVLRYSPGLNKESLGSVLPRPNMSRHDVVALARRVANERGAFSLALEGNLKLFGIPVWTGTLPTALRTVSFVIYGDQGDPTLGLFIKYILGPQGQSSISELGFQTVSP